MNEYTSAILGTMWLKITLLFGGYLKNIVLNIVSRDIAKRYRDIRFSLYRPALLEADKNSYIYMWIQENTNQLGVFVSVCVCVCSLDSVALYSVGPASLKYLIRLMSVINPCDLVLLFLPSSAHHSFLPLFYLGKVTSLKLVWWDSLSVVAAVCVFVCVKCHC